MFNTKLHKALLGASMAATLCIPLAAHAQTADSPTTSNKATSGMTGAAGTTGTTGVPGMSGATGGAAASGAKSGAGMTGSTDSSSATGTTGSSGMTSASGASAASGTSVASGTLAKADQTIVIGMARANMAEIAAGKLALSNAESAAVKSYAQMMIDDHTKALNDVTALAQKKGVTLPTEPDAKHKAMADKLSKLKGGAFDKAYMAQAGVADHKAVHAKLKKDQTAAKDPDVKMLATNMLPTVETHLKTATEHKH